jgi:5'-methylthioadenosine nucleosidase
MEAEADPFLAKYSLKEIPSSHPLLAMKTYQGQYNDNLKVSVVVNGKCKRFGVDNVGTTPAALSTYLSVMEHKPDLIINAGTGGGFKAKGAEIGDAFLATKACHHDRRIAIPGFTEMGIGNHSMLETPNLRASLGFKSGVVSTSNSLDHVDKDDEMMLQNDASIKEMEAAAIAWVAEQTSTPLICLKVITDIVDGDRASQDEFLENLASAARSLQENIPKLLDGVAGKSLGAL